MVRAARWNLTKIEECCSRTTQTQQPSQVRRGLTNERCAMCRLSTIEARLSQGKEGKSGGKIAFPQFLEMFRADLLDIKEILQFLQMDSSAPSAEKATVPEVGDITSGPRHLAVKLYMAFSLYAKSTMLQGKRMAVHLRQGCKSEASN